jgi:hypothetical protein
MTDRPTLSEFKAQLESRRAARDREFAEADSKNQLWTIYGALRYNPASRERSAFILVHLGKRDDESYDAAFSSQHADSGIIYGPQLLIGTRPEIIAQIGKMFTGLTEITFRFIEN